MMTTLFDITGDDIAQLNDADLRSLIGQLCEADYRSCIKNDDGQWLSDARRV